MHQKNQSLVFYTRLIQHRQKINRNAGLSIIEIIVVLALTALLAAIAAPAVTFGSDPLRDSTRRITASFKLARAKAMASTSAVRIRPLSNNEFIMERASRCSDTTWTSISDRVQKDGQLVVEDLSIDTPAQLTDAKENGTTTTNWSLCFNSRGVADKNLQLTITNTNNSRQQTMEVFSGGAIDLGNVS